MVEADATRLLAYRREPVSDGGRLVRARHGAGRRAVRGRGRQGRNAEFERDFTFTQVYLIYKIVFVCYHSGILVFYVFVINF